MIPLESEEQKALVKYLKLKKLDFFAVVNENNHSKLNRIAAIKIEAKNKAMGKVKGASDVVVFTPTKILFIELKRVKGSVTSKEQKAFMERVNKYPYAKGKICFGVMESITFIENNLGDC